MTNKEDRRIVEAAQYPRFESPSPCIVEYPMCCRCGTGHDLSLVCSTCAIIEQTAKYEQFRNHFDPDRILDMMAEIERLEADVVRGERRIAELRIEGAANDKRLRYAMGTAEKEVDRDGC